MAGDLFHLLYYKLFAQITQTSMKQLGHVVAQNHSKT